MIYADLQAGATVFVDASVFSHHFEPNALFGPSATAFLERIENQELIGITATHLISETAPRLMTIEAMQTYGWKSAGIALRLRNHPGQVQALKRFREAVQHIGHFGLKILTIEPSWLDAAAEISQQSGLLHNDALSVAVMRAHALTNLASADSDFDRVTGIVRYAPGQN
jgi:predicted nucleic acid-binding protein